MCAQYEMTFSAEILAKKLHAQTSAPQTLMGRIFPYSRALVLIRREGTTLLEPMMYNLIPAWSLEKKTKFATYNARVETIDQKPSFKKTLGRYHCIVPMTSFFESVREKRFAGNIVKFSSPEPLMAAGLYDIWTNKQTGEILESFAIITKEPPAFVADAGHDRCPVFLKGDAVNQWLTPSSRNPKQWKEFLLKTDIDQSITAEIDRPLKNFTQVRKLNDSTL